MKSAKYYRRNNNGKPQVWWCNLAGHEAFVYHGILGGKIHEERYGITKKTAEAELKSRINDKIKAGYITLSEVVDETGQPPVEDINNPILAAYLERYLPYDLGDLPPLPHSMLPSSIPGSLIQSHSLHHRKEYNHTSIGPSYHGRGYHDTGNGDALE